MGTLYGRRTDEDRRSRFRARLLGAGAAVVFAGLLARMYQLQVVGAADYAARAERNVARDYDLPAYRGPILDVTGTVLAANRSSFNVYITPYFFREPQSELDLLRDLLHLTDFRLAAIVEELARPSRFPRLEPFLAVEDVRREEVALLESARVHLPGVHVTAIPHRDYPLGSRAAHLVGYLNETSEAELARDPSYRPGDMVGRFGIERAWETALRGLDGREKLMRDARGFIVENPEITRRTTLPPALEPVPGSAVVLTIDADLQAVMEHAFAAFPSGAAVLVEVETGKVRGIYSKPTFDLNLMGGRLSTADKALLDSDPLLPQIDRAVYQRLPPGSTFKVVTALAALQEGLVDPSYEVYCPGYYRLGTHVFRCHLRSGHGVVNLRDAIVKSCDTWFWNVSEMLGIDMIARYARDMGLGEVTGIGINGEVPGIMPDRAWYDRHSPEGFRPGHTTNVAVGQGSVTVTPMQMVMLYAALANGGKLLRPLLVERLVDSTGATIDSFPPEVRRVLSVDPAHIATIDDALWGVTHSPGGTAAGAASRFPKLKVAGKTGTAQVITTSFTPGTEGDRTKPKRGRLTESHAWFAAYAPHGAPTVAVVVIVEHGGGGGAAAAPVAMKILDGWFRLDSLRGAGDVRFPLPLPDKPLKYKISREGWSASLMRPFGAGAAGGLGLLAGAPRVAWADDPSTAKLPGVVLW